MANSFTSRPILSVQALRALAACAITTTHTWPDISHLFLYHLRQPCTIPGMGTGSIGVDLFFVLSGFIMVYSSDKLFGSSAGALTFVYRRLVRIIPLYWLATTALLLYWHYVIGTNLTQENATLRNVIESYLFIPSDRIGPFGHITPILGQAWTLYYEMFFYMLFAAFVIFSRRMAVLGLGFFIILLVTLSMYFGVSGLPHWLAWFPNPLLFEFVIGLVIGLVYVEKIQIPRSMAWIALATGFAMIVIIAASDHEVSRELSRSVIVSSCGLILFGAVFGITEPKMPGRTWRLIAFLGDSSYALYLTHGMVIMSFRMTFLSLGVWLAQWPWLLVIVMVTTSNAVAIVVHLWIEKPMTNWLRRGVTLIPARSLVSQQEGNSNKATARV